MRSWRRAKANDEAKVQAAKDGTRLGDALKRKVMFYYG